MASSKKVDKVKPPHTFFHTALAAFISHFSKNIEPFRDLIDGPVPVAIHNTGDEVFLATMKWKTEDQKKKLYDCNPRLTFSVGNIAKNEDNLTNPHQLGKLAAINDDTGFTEPWRAHVRRVPVNVNMPYELKFSNIDQYFKFVDVMLTVIQQQQIFEFVYAGTVHRGGYKLSADGYDSSPNFSLGHDAEKRRRTMDGAIEVQLQFPAFDVYSANLNKPEIFGESQRMNKLIHNVYLNGDENLVSTMTYPSSSTT